MSKQIGAQSTEQSIERSQHHHADGHHVQRREALVHQDLVDDDLREQRGEECEQLEKERGEQYLAQQPPVLQHRGNEPGDVEGEILHPEAPRVSYRAAVRRSMSRDEIVFRLNERPPPPADPE